MTKKRIKILYVSSVILALAVLFQMGLYVLDTAFNWNMKYNIFSFCHSLLKGLGFASLELIQLGLAASILLVSCWLLIRQLFLSRRIYRRLMHRKLPQWSEKLHRLFPETNGRLTVIDTDQPFAVTMGLIRPKIIISSGLMKLLNADEQKAVIQHEIYHQKERDPLHLFVLTFLHSVLWFLPILKWASQQYKIVKECLADEYAIQQTGTSTAIGSALLKMIKSGSTKQLPFTYVSFADTSVNYRIQYLLDPDTELSFRPPLKYTVASGYVFAGLCAMFVFTWM